MTKITMQRKVILLEELEVDEAATRQQQYIEKNLAIATAVQKQLNSIVTSKSANKGTIYLDTIKISTERYGDGLLLNVDVDVETS